MRELDDHLVCSGRDPVIAENLDHREEVRTHLFEVDRRLAIRGLLAPVDLGLDGARADVVVEAQDGFERLARDCDIPHSRRATGRRAETCVHHRQGSTSSVSAFGREVLSVVVF
jgi:hypothetical protein